MCIRDIPQQWVHSQWRLNCGPSPKELIQIEDSRIPGVQGSSETK